MKRLRSDVTLEPIGDLLRERLVDEGWLEDEETNLALGYGRGIPGIVSAKEHLATALEGAGSMGALGVYRAGEPVGFVLLAEAPAIRRAVRFQMLLAPHARGRAIAPTALARLCERVFATPGAYRLEIEVLSTNKGAIEWLKHEGFTQEGFRKHAWWSDGSPHSTVVLRMLAPQWRRREGQHDAGSPGGQGRLHTVPESGSNPGPAPNSVPGAVVASGKEVGGELSQVR